MQIKFWLFLLFCWLLLCCTTDPEDEIQLELSLNDSLARYDSVSIRLLQLRSGDSLWEKVHQGKLVAPILITHKVLVVSPDSFLVVVEGFDELGLRQQAFGLFFADGDRKEIVNLWQPSVPPDTIDADSTKSDTTGTDTTGPDSLFLAELAAYPGTIEPDFDPSRREYIIHLPYEQNALLLVPELDSGVVVLSGDTLASGDSSDAIIGLAVGDSLVTLQTHDLSGTAEPITYSLTIRRAASTKAALASLSLCGFCTQLIEPRFHPDSQYYLQRLLPDQSGLSIMATTEEGGLLLVNGDTVSSGLSYKMDSVHYGTNILELEVVSQNRQTRRRYTIHAFRHTTQGPYELPQLPGGCGTPALAMATYRAIPYALYTDCSQSGRLSLSAYYDGAWNAVGPKGISMGGAGTLNTQFGSHSLLDIAFDAGGIPHVAYVDDANGKKITAKKIIDGQWRALGVEGFSQDVPAGGSGFAIRIWQGKPHLLYRGTQWRFLRFGGLQWEELDAPDGGDALIEHNDLLYTSYLADGSPVLARFEGGIWQHDKIEVSYSAVGSVSLSSGEGKLFLGFHEGFPSPRVFSTSGSEWTSLLGPENALPKAAGVAAVVYIPAIVLRHSGQSLFLATELADGKRGFWRREYDNWSYDGDAPVDVSQSFAASHGYLTWGRAAASNFTFTAYWDQQLFIAIP